MRYLFLLLSIFTLSCTNPANQTEISNSSIQPSTKYPQYWMYNGEEILLLGGSREDNLFQIPDLEEHLDLLKSVGGNYVRNTMSSRDSGNVWPFMQLEDGHYDLNQWNQEYWDRFEKFLRLTDERNIIVQIEIWATFDFYRENWDINPYNPANNINYDERVSKLPVKVETHPVYTENNFFRSVPSQMAIATVLDYQRKYVDKLLSYSLAYDHILYCMDNETSVTAEWGKFWSFYIQKKAAEKNKTVYTTEMWDPWDLAHPFHNETFDHPEIYGFVDISQNNHITGEKHWVNGLTQLQRLKNISALRPVNNVKVYGNDGGRHKTTRNGIESFIQNIFLGCASARFHRPTSGQGLNKIAQAVIRSMRDLTDRMDWFNIYPDNSLLSDREEHEAYCRCLPGKEYAIYFPDGGEVSLDLTQYERDFSVQWLNILQSEWEQQESVKGGSNISLQTPGTGHWIVLIVALTG